MNKRKLAIVAVLLLALAIAVGLAATNWNRPATSQEKEVVAERETVQDACASRETFAGLKQLLFDRAGRTRTSDDTANFGVLAETAFVRMENPVVEGRDEALGLISCSGRFILDLPPGAERAFGGERRLTAMVNYEVRPAADGSGPVYRMRGADAIVSRLAAFELEGEPLQPPVEPAADDETDLNMSAELFEPAIPAEPVPMPAPPPPPEPRPEPRAFANPSYDCRDARTRSEIMVCRSDRLARADRRMASLYDSAVAAADPRTRRELRRSRDRFLAYRERCGGEDCVAQAYQDRMAEISDIMAARGY